MALVGVALVLLETLGDACWPVTLLLYGPRWPIVVPTLVLVPITVAARHHGATFLVLLTGLLGLWGYMGFNVPWQTLVQVEPTSRVLRVVAFNADGKSLKEPLENFIAKEHPDILVVPECRLLGTHGKHTTLTGFYGVRVQGVCFFSRFHIRNVLEDEPGGSHEKIVEDGIALITLEGDDGPFQVLALHLETVRKGLEALARADGPEPLAELTELRRRQSQLALVEYAENAEYPLVVVGDFNLPVESRIYANVWSRFNNGFTKCGWGYGSTKHTSWYGIRIDHVLMDDSWRCVAARVGGDLGSDHRPLIVDVARR